MNSLGMVRLDLGDPEGAASWLQESVDIFSDLGDPDGAAARGNLGRALDRVGRHREAEIEHRAALEMYRSMGSTDSAIPSILSNLAVRVLSGAPRRSGGDCRGGAHVVAQRPRRRDRRRQGRGQPRPPTSSSRVGPPKPSSWPPPRRRFSTRRLREARVRSPPRPISDGPSPCRAISTRPCRFWNAWSTSLQHDSGRITWSPRGVAPCWAPPSTAPGEPDQPSVSLNTPSELSGGQPFRRQPRGISWWRGRLCAATSASPMRVCRLPSVRLRRTSRSTGPRIGTRLTPGSSEVAVWRRWIDPENPQVMAEAGAQLVLVRGADAWESRRTCAGAP